MPQKKENQAGGTTCVSVDRRDTVRGTTLSVAGNSSERNMWPRMTCSECDILLLLQVYGVGTHLRNVASWEVMSGNRLCIQGNVSTPSFGGNGVDSPAENRFFQPRVGSGSRKRTQCHGASEGKLRF